MQQANQQNKIDLTGDTVLCVASGPSLDTDDIDYAKGRCRVIAINDNYQTAPFADILYACDLKWWDWHKGAPEFAGLKYSMDKKVVQKYDVNYIEGKGGIGLSSSSEFIHTGSNSGFQAINLAYLLGARRVLLTGYDMKFAATGAAHWFGDHPDKVRSGYARFIDAFKQIDQANIEIINCTRDTALKCFPQMTIQEAI